MKLFFQILPSILLLSIPLLLVESSNHEFNIIRGSSISTSPSNESNGTYWLSPSGNIAFGFYPLCYGCHQYIVGIWFVNTANNVLVWSANRNDPPLYHPSSILLNNDGKLILQTAGGGDKPLLFDVWEPVSYAVMHDNGNFILYGYNSRIIWESFNYPTDTILGGQKLIVGQTLISRVNYFDRSYGKYMLRVNQYDHGFVIYRRYSILENPVKWETSMRRKGSLITLNLDSTGRLYIVNTDDLVLKNYTKGENQQQKIRIEKNVIYRATLETNGLFYLYRDRIGIEGEKSIQIWDSDKDYRESSVKFFLMGLSIMVVGGVAIMLAQVIEFKWPTIPKWLKITSTEKEKDPDKDPKVNLKEGLLS